ncbi:winged helix DNA-binding domain-containing protein [Streptomyces polyrhachis]|uniref:Winged helix DNA-binding domain-containing protein n=1 Tax=Streptomyces polyrhachis TaxID=1282885 RepID=A0ABW2GGI1_9ACTN
MADVLGGRALNRALLERQWLSARRDAGAVGPVAAMEHLAGMQAQAGDAPYYQLHARLDGFTPRALSDALTDRAAARVVLMRGTIHLVSARDVLPMRTVVQPFLDTVLFHSTAGKQVAGVDPAAVTAAAREVLADGPLANEELGERLAGRLPGYEGNALAYLARCLLPLVQVPPRGVWGQGGGLVYALAEQWLDVEAGTGRAADPATDATPDDLVLRYLAAFGPASVADAQKWSSLTGLRAVFERLRPRLVSYRDEAGRELFDLAGTELPDPGREIEPFLLGPFDNALLSHADRSRIIAKEYERKVFTHNGIVRGAIMLDGFVAGLWKPVLKRREATVEFTAFRTFTRAERAALEQRAAELLEFAAPETERRRTVFTEP